MKISHCKRAKTNVNGLLFLQLRLGDMELFIEVEKDFTVYGDECKFGGGKVTERVNYKELKNFPSPSCLVQSIPVFHLSS